VKGGTNKSEPRTPSKPSAMSEPYHLRNPHIESEPQAPSKPRERSEPYVMRKPIRMSEKTASPAESDKI